MTQAILATDLTRTFGNHLAVDRVRIDVPWGRIHGYLGLNGAGKSTTIKMLTTLLAPTSGRALVAGYDVRDEPQAVRGAIGLVGDEGGASQPSWTAEEYLLYFARIRGLAEPRTVTRNVLDQVGIETQWRRRAMGTYSTGMRRRVEVARALLGDPQVLFLDEPTQGLDLPAKCAMWDLLRRLVAGRQASIFLSSHDAAEVQALCHDVTVLAKGRVTYAGPAAALGGEPGQFEAALLDLLRGAPLPRGGPHATPPAQDSSLVRKGAPGLRRGR